MKDDIAIIGMSGRFPGAKNVQQFWENLLAGKESITFLSDQELRESGTPESLILNPSYVKAASVLEGIDQFDADFFGISPKEAISMDPQHRFFLECAYEALLDGGYTPGKSPLNVGVFAGAGSATTSYLLEYIKAHPEIQGLSANFHSWGTDKDYFTTRTSYKLNLTGPSFDVQTGCSTSLVAVHLACEALKHDQCALALAGGVSIRIPHIRGYLSSEGDVHSHDGHCRTFDAASSGTVFGSGIGIVLLKKHALAVRDNDRIYAVIKGSWINNDGSEKSSYPSPSHQGQSACISEGLLRYHIAPETIQLMEAHGTGTIVGDPIEIQSLTKAFAFNKTGICALSSLKPNIGHLGAASGVASLIKLALSLYYKKMPAHINYTKPNPLIDFSSTPFYINTETKDWTSTTVRRGAINSFGVGGTNAFAVLEEAASIQKPPLYHPFKGKKYWIEAPSLHHPLLGRQVDVSLVSEEIVYENILKADSYLKDHKICGRILFPAAGFIEILVAIGKSVGLSLPLEITSFEIKQALEIKSEVRIQTKLKKVENGYEASIYSFDQNWRSHVSALITPAKTAPIATLKHLGNPKELYSRVAALGYQYGPHFRTVQEGGTIKTNDKMGAYTLYPPLLDGAFQLNIGTSLTLPVSIESIHILEPLPQEVKVEVHQGHFVLYSLLGKPLLHIKKLEKKPVDADAFVRLLDQKILYKELWQKSKLEKTPSSARNWLLVYASKTSLYTRVKESLGNCHELHVSEMPKVIEGMDVINFLPYEGDDFYASVALLQAFLKAPDQSSLFFTLTRGISPIKGLHRSLKQEFPHCRLIHIAIECEDSLVDELLYPDLEPEILLKEGGRYINRIAPYSPTIASSKPQEKPSLKEDEIEVEPFAAALNFRDVLNSLGLYPGERGPLGSDFCGVIKNKGSKVPFALGETVYGLAPGTFQNPIVTSHQLVAKKPSTLSPLEAAGIPIVYLTTHYALNHLVKLKKGDKILIHAAAGGIGLAAIHLAQSLGAEIYATVSTPHKKAYLESLGIKAIYSSRSLDYGDALSGIDVVLNSLTGEGCIEASLKVLAKGGAFIELGKRNIWTIEQMGKARPDVKYEILALDEIRKKNPEKIQELLLEIEPSPLPHTVFPFTQLKSAFQYLQDAQHIGKVIVKFPSQWKKNTDGTYLITGGAGGLGMKTAEWLVNQGAKKILLVSRNVPPTLNLPPEITVEACDITDEEQVQALFIRHPIKGIIHAAGVLHQAGFLNHSKEDFEKVLAPKVKGAEILHRVILKQKLALDFIVYFSSTSALLGGHGRSAYAAANSFLDQFAAYQQHCGLPALSIAYGAWEEVGMAVPHLKQMQKLGNRGLEPKEALNALKHALETQEPYLAATLTDWSLYIPQVVKDNPRFNLLKVATKTSLENTPDLYSSLAAAIRKVLGQPLDYPVDYDEPFIQQKLDSLNQIEFLAEIEKNLRLKQTLRASDLQKYPTIRKLAAYLNPSLVVKSLGSIQAHYWNTQGKNDFNISRSVIFKEPIQIDSLEQAFNAVLKLHPIFYSIISNDTPTYTLAPFKEFKLEYSQEDFKQHNNTRITSLPKVRGIINDNTLQVICPHSISDGRSLHLFLTELDRAYTSLREGKPFTSSSPDNNYQEQFHAYDKMVDENGEKKQALIEKQIAFRAELDQDSHEPPLSIEYPLSYRHQFQATCQELGIEATLVLNGLSALALSFITEQTDFSSLYASDGIFSPRFAEVIGPFNKQIPFNFSRKKSDTLESYLERIKTKQYLWSYLKEFPSSLLTPSLAPEKWSLFSFFKKKTFPVLLGVTEIELKEYTHFSSLYRSTLLDRMQEHQEVVNIQSIIIQKEWNLYVSWPLQAKNQKILREHLERLISYFTTNRKAKLQRIANLIK